MNHETAGRGGHSHKGRLVIGPQIRWVQQPQRRGTCVEGGRSVSQDIDNAGQCPPSQLLQRGFSIFDLKIDCKSVERKGIASPI